MADKWAVASGNWSSTSTWNDGTLPGPDDDVYADGWTVSVNQSVTILSLNTTQRSGGTSGGEFSLVNGVVVTATSGAFAGPTRCVVFAFSGATSATFNGAVFGGTGTNAYGAANMSSGTLILNGDATGGS